MGGQITLDSRWLQGYVHHAHADRILWQFRLMQTSHSSQTLLLDILSNKCLDGLLNLPISVSRVAKPPEFVTVSR